jgi:hypothetical protein
MKQEDRSCSKCKHQAFDLFFRIMGNHNLIRCERPNRKIDPVTGGLREAYCGNQRMFDLLDCCGPQGKYFEHK